LNKNNIERDHSWRRLLRVSQVEEDVWNTKQSYVKAVFDDPKFDNKNVGGSLEVICSEATKASGGGGWRMLFIKAPRLFSICNQGFIVRNDDEIVLLHESQRNHYHSELYSKYLDYELDYQEIDISPFQYKGYESARSGEDYTYLKLNKFCFSREMYYLEVWYEEGTYHLLFGCQGNTEGPFPDGLLNTLQGLEFSPILNWKGYDLEFWPCGGSEQILFIKTPDRVTKKISEICEKLKAL